MSVLGKFAVIMADPPWDIHMELPYGTMSDEEMSRLDIPCLQTEGYIFLWVTGRAMEQGRECLRLWGYQCLEEIIWVKTNQLQRIIRTGRTGHWINHGKEHCLVGVKGNPKVRLCVSPGDRSIGAGHEQGTRLRRDRVRGQGDEPQARRDLRHHRETVSRHAEAGTVRTAAQLAAELVWP